MRVQVYYNLHKHLFSIRDKKSRLIIAHEHEIYLENCLFYVSEKGRQRVLRERKKSVHAWVEGDWIRNIVIEGLDNYKEAYYNPYVNESFIDILESCEIKKCDKVLLSNKKIYYK